jgi:hypothetical protein
VPDAVDMQGLDLADDDASLPENTDNWYDSIEEANLRLAGSIVKYDGKPVYVSEVAFNPKLFGDNRIRVYFYPLPIVGEGEKQRRVLTSPKFDFKAFSVGFVMINQSLCFIGRAPCRRYQQGLTDGNSRIQGNASFRDLLYSQEFVDACCGIRKNFREYIAGGDPWNPASGPISFSFAFKGEDNGTKSLLYCKGGPITTIGLFRDNGNYELNPKYSFLKELLIKEYRDAH